MSNQLLDQLYMDPVLFDPRVRTADNTCHSTDSSIDDIVIERCIGSPECPTEMIIYGLVGETMNPHGGYIGNFNGQLTVFESHNCHFNDVVSAFSGRMFMKFNMFRSLNMAPRIGGEKLCTITLSHFCPVSYTHLTLPTILLV